MHLHQNKFSKICRVAVKLILVLRLFDYMIPDTGFRFIMAIYSISHLEFAHGDSIKVLRVSQFTPIIPDRRSRVYIENIVANDKINKEFYLSHN